MEPSSDGDHALRAAEVNTGARHKREAPPRWYVYGGTVRIPRCPWQRRQVVEPPDVRALRVLPPPATQPFERWSLDFLSDSLADGRRFRVLTIVDNVSRVSPAIAIGTSLTGERADV